MNSTQMQTKLNDVLSRAALLRNTKCAQLPDYFPVYWQYQDWALKYERETASAWGRFKSNFSFTAAGRAKANANKYTVKMLDIIGVIEKAVVKIEEERNSYQPARSQSEPIFTYSSPLGRFLTKRNYSADDATAVLKTYDRICYGIR